jgi:hypothetical protein
MRETAPGFLLGRTEVNVVVTSQADPQSDPGWPAAMTAVIVSALYYQ